MEKANHRGQKNALTSYHDACARERAEEAIVRVNNRDYHQCGELCAKVESFVGCPAPAVIFRSVRRQLRSTNIQTHHGKGIAADSYLDRAAVGIHGPYHYCFDEFLVLCMDQPWDVSS